MDWSHRLTSTISYKSKASFSDGDFSFGTTATAKARVWRQDKIIPGPGGQQIACTHAIATETDLEEGTRVWLPGATVSDVTESYAIMRRQTAAMLDGSYTLYIYYLGR